MQKCNIWAHSVLGLALALSVSTASAQDPLARARQLETGGNSADALRTLRDAANARGATEASISAYADFLDRYGDPAARDAYSRALPVINDAARKRSTLRRLIILDLQAADQASAARHLNEYRAAGGTDLPDRIAAPPAVNPAQTIAIPGPITGFLRMAALSPDLKLQDMLAALGRNVVINGYQSANSQSGLEQTEYMKLLIRYLSQARELETLSGPTKKLTIATCESATTGELLRILGYRMRGACGGELVLETVNASRAFLTIDSGFPLAELEQALRNNRSFEMPYAPNAVPVLFGPEYWLSAKDKPEDFITMFLGDPALCRLYVGMSKLDSETAAELRKELPVARLKAFAHVLDFFGGMFVVRNGQVPVPGGDRSAAAWTELAGIAPNTGAKFLERLLTREDGWLSGYFDSLSRIDGPLATYLTEPERLKRFYTALRGRVTSPGPARPVFRSNTDLMLLTTRLHIDSSGKPVLPGDIDVWKTLFTDHPQAKYDAKLTRAAAAWKDPDDVVEALFALCKKLIENEPLKMFMAISDINRGRPVPLKPATVSRMIQDYRAMEAQYPIFADLPTLSDEGIVKYLDLAKSIGSIRDLARRTETAGTFQSLIGLWQILTRNEVITPAASEETFQEILTLFTATKDEYDVFTGGIAGVRALLKAAHIPASDSPQDRIIELLAGTTKPSDEEAHALMVSELNRLFEAQNLVSIKLLFEVADHLDARAKGEPINSALLNRITARLAEIKLPRASLTGAEKTASSYGYYNERHIERQRKLTIRPLVERAGIDPGKLNGVRGELAAVLRDTLVGFNYLYYAPPGAELIRTNPVFVRSHDFLGMTSSPQTWKTTLVQSAGWPTSGGGRLVGSLANLAYALADAEQNFLVPTREQALIWNDLVPQMMISAKMPRWWKTTQAQMHWVGLHLRLGGSLVAESIIDPKLRDSVIQSVERLAPPSRASDVRNAVAAGDFKTAMENLTSSELYLIAMQHMARTPQGGGSLEQDIRRLAQTSGAAVSPAVISRTFGTPKPTLTNSYRQELLNLRTFPTLMGYSSRIMAESWESSTLYYVALADELHLNPGRLNVVIPQWTQGTIERIFASNLEDWPALLRSLYYVGDEVRSKSRLAIARGE
jgi:hypothetical protein